MNAIIAAWCRGKSGFDLGVQRGCGLFFLQ